MENPIIVLKNWLLALDCKQSDLLSKAVLSYMPGVYSHPYEVGRDDLVEFLNKQCINTPQRAFDACLCLNALISGIVDEYDKTDDVRVSYQHQKTKHSEHVDLLINMEADFMKLLKLRKEVKTEWQHIANTYYNLEYLTAYWLKS